jgi:hypothetical protein
LSPARRLEVIFARALSSYRSARPFFAVFVCDRSHYARFIDDVHEQ